jgi:hypothetical protein
MNSTFSRVNDIYHEIYFMNNVEFFKLGGTHCVKNSTLLILNKTLLEGIKQRRFFPHLIIT